MVLNEAVEIESAEIVRFLLDSGVIVSLVGDDGVSCLSVAVETGYTIIVKLLLNAGAPVNIQSKVCNSSLCMY